MQTTDWSVGTARVVSSSTLWSNISLSTFSAVLCLAACSLSCKASFLIVMNNRVCAVWRECVVEQKRGSKKCKLIKCCRYTERHELTSESSVDSLDSPVQQREASLLNPAARCESAAALSIWSGWTSELRPEKHSCSLTNRSSTIWIKKKWCKFKRQCSCVKSFSVW